MDQQLEGFTYVDESLTNQNLNDTYNLFTASKSFDNLYPISNCSASFNLSQSSVNSDKLPYNISKEYTHELKLIEGTCIRRTIYYLLNYCYNNKLFYFPDGNIKYERYSIKIDQYKLHSMSSNNNDFITIEKEATINSFKNEELFLYSEDDQHSIVHNGNVVLHINPTYTHTSSYTIPHEYTALSPRIVPKQCPPVMNTSINQTNFQSISNQTSSLLNPVLQSENKHKSIFARISRKSNQQSNQQNSSESTSTSKTKEEDSTVKTEKGPISVTSHSSFYLDTSRLSSPSGTSYQAIRNSSNSTEPCNPLLKTSTSSQYQEVEPSEFSTKSVKPAETNKSNNPELNGLFSQAPQLKELASHFTYNQKHEIASIKAINAIEPYEESSVFTESEISDDWQFQRNAYPTSSDNDTNINHNNTNNNHMHDSTLHPLSSSLTSSFSYSVPVSLSLSSLTSSPSLSSPSSPATTTATTTTSSTSSTLHLNSSKPPYNVMDHHKLFPSSDESEFTSVHSSKETLKCHAPSFSSQLTTDTSTDLFTPASYIHDSIKGNAGYDHQKEKCCQYYGCYRKIYSSANNQENRCSKCNFFFCEEHKPQSHTIYGKQLLLCENCYKLMLKATRHNSKSFLENASLSSTSSSPDSSFIPNRLITVKFISSPIGISLKNGKNNKNAFLVHMNRYDNSDNGIMVALQSAVLQINEITTINMEYSTIINILKTISYPVSITFGQLADTVKDSIKYLLSKTVEKKYHCNFALCHESLTTSACQRCAICNRLYCTKHCRKLLYVDDEEQPSYICSFCYPCIFRPFEKKELGRWIPDYKVNQCTEQGCTVEFSSMHHPSWTRRHHCRLCGNIYCDQHCNKRVVLSEFNMTKAVRVCNDCFL